MKKVVIMLCMLFVLLPTQVFAHSKMTESIPTKDETLSISPEQIVLTYNTAISPISKFTLLNEQGEEQQINDLTAVDNQLKATIDQPLANGIYTVAWTIIGADTHVIDGEFSFTVLAPEPPPSIAPTEETTTSQSETGTEPDISPDATTETEPEATAVTEEVPANSATNDKSQSVNAQDNEDASKEGTNLWPFAVLAILAVVAVIIVFKRRK